MLTYKYKAISKDGAKVDGVLKAYNEFEAVDIIKQTCSVVTKVTVVPESVREPKELFGPRKVKEKVLAMICSQFSIILGSGMPIVRAVELIADQAADPALKKILKYVAADVASGHSLAQSFEMHGKQLPITFIETVRAGEESGTLEHSFAKLHIYYDKTAKTKAKVSSAMAYPIFTCGIAVIVIAIIMVVAVPVFTRTFIGMGLTLPLPTKLLIGFSNFITGFWALLLLLIVAVIIGLKLWGKTERGKLFFAARALKRPLFGKLAEMRGASQFASTTSTLLAAGISMVNTMNITSKVMDNYLIGNKLRSVVSGIEEGKRLGDCMQKCDCFPTLLLEMTAVGEETGSLENTLEVISRFYDNEVEMLSGKILSLLEPIIIVVLAFFVVFILLAVYLPIFSMYGGIS